MSAQHDSVSNPTLHTDCIRAGFGPDPQTGAILPPIHQSTTFVQPAVGQDRGFTYSRSGNPTVAALEARLGALEAAQAACFATGMAAITALVLATCSAGDTVVLASTVYGGTTRLLRDVLGRFGVRTRTDGDPSGARLVLVESPANPTLDVTDIAEVAACCRTAGALLAVDNTFLTPVLQRPLDLGADFSVYSTTKYIDGHNATVGGAIVGHDLDAVRFIQNALGIGQKPHEAWLTLQGLKTLPLRIERHVANARAVRAALEEHPAVHSVRYGGGGMLAFEVRGDAVAVMNHLRLCSLAENLGAVETLVTHPATMTHACVPPEERRAAGIPDGLVRLSVGLERADDLVADLEEALSWA